MYLHDWKSTHEKGNGEILCEYSTNAEGTIINGISNIKIPNDFSSICEWLAYNRKIEQALRKTGLSIDILGTNINDLSMVQTSDDIQKLLEDNNFKYLDHDANGFSIFRKDNVDIHIDVIKHEDEL